MSTPLVPCSILIPLAYNDGTLVNEQTMEEIKDEIFILFGGYTVEGVKEGAYRREDTGAKQVEKHLAIKVAVPGDEGVEQLRRVLEQVGDRLGQEAMYLEIHVGSKVELISTRKKGGR